MQISFLLAYPNTSHFLAKCWQVTPHSVTLELRLVLGIAAWEIIYYGDDVVFIYFVYLKHFEITEVVSQEAMAYANTEVNT